MTALRLTQRLRSPQGWQCPTAWAIAVVSSMVSLIASPTPAQAIDQETMILLTDPLEIELLEEGTAALDESITTSTTISQTHLTVPSLWWAQEQFGGKLLNSWLAYSGENDTPRRVDLIVNQQVWVLYSYLERYAFLNHFGASSRDFGYNTRIFNRQEELLGVYACNFSELQPINPPLTSYEALTAETSSDDVPGLQCDIYLDPFGPGALRGSSTNPFGAF